MRTAERLAGRIVAPLGIQFPRASAGTEYHVAKTQSASGARNIDDDARIRLATVPSFMLLPLRKTCRELW